MRTAALLLVCAACGSGSDRVSGSCSDKAICVADAAATCDPLTQQGCGSNEKCGWSVTKMGSDYAGVVACSHAGTKAGGAACVYAPTDDCSKGFACTAFAGGSGTCAPICDPQLGSAVCNGAQCVLTPGVFGAGSGAPTVGLCE